MKMASFLTFLAFALQTFALTADDVRNMPVNSWLSIPNTKLRALDPCPGSNCVYTGVEGFEGIHSYSGGAFDTERNRLIIWGGGHNAYYGNELCVYDVDEMKWYRLTDPSTNINVSGYGGDPYPDGQPASRHSYNGLAYITHADRFVALGGALAAQWGGCGTDVTWTFDFTQNKWFNMQPGGGQPAPECDDLMAYDPIGKKVWWGESGGFYSYDIDANRWTHVDSDFGYGRMISIVDTKRRLLVIVGGDGYGGQYWVISYNLAAANVKASRQVWNTTGGDSFISDYFKGLSYDPVADRYVGVDGDNTVWDLNPDTKVWTSHAPTGPGPDQGHLAGIYGLWQYSPNVNAYIFHTKVDNDVHFYKFTAGAGQTGVNARGKGREAEFSVAAAPNPFNPAVTISSSVGHSALVIYNTQGRIVHQASMTTNAYTWNASGLPSGVYLLKITAAGKTRTQRLFLKK